MFFFIIKNPFQLLTRKRQSSKTLVIKVERSYDRFELKGRKKKYFILEFFFEDWVKNVKKKKFKKSPKRWKKFEKHIFSTFWWFFEKIYHFFNSIIYNLSWGMVWLAGEIHLLFEQFFFAFFSASLPDTSFSFVDRSSS